MVHLIYDYLYRSTELGNWQSEYKEEKVVTDERLENMKESCIAIGMTYSEKYKEFFMINVDKLYAVRITVKENLI